MSTKKRTRNVPVLHQELKQRHQIMITPNSWKKMQQASKKLGISISELIEGWAISLDGE